jgi:hypothetical protein
MAYETASERARRQERERAQAQKEGLEEARATSGHGHPLYNASNMYGYSLEDLDLSGYRENDQQSRGEYALKLARDKRYNETPEYKAWVQENQKSGNFLDRVSNAGSDMLGAVGDFAEGAGPFVALAGSMAMGNMALNGTLGGAGGAAVANPMGSGFTGTGPGVSTAGLGSATSAPTSLASIISGGGVPGAAQAAQQAGGVGGFLAGPAGQSILDIGLGIMSGNAIDKSQDAIEAGFEKQNPWSVHQPAMGTTLMELLSDPSKISETPGYQFAFDQGLDALHATQAARGGRFSGRAMEEAQQFGSGLASQMWNQEMNRYASLAGANQPITGGVTMGQDLSALNQADNYNQGYAITNILSNILKGSGNNTQSPSVTNPFLGTNIRA